MPNLPKPVVIAAGVLLAVVLNLLVYAGGRAAGGTFRITTAGVPSEVDALTVAGFSAVPLLIGLTAVALLSRFGDWVIRSALVTGPALALGTILLMTVPAGFDAVSAAALALCHVVLAPITVVAVLALRPRPALVPA